MRFYVIGYSDYFDPKGKEIPCFVLRKDGWNDLGIISLFKLEYYSSEITSEYFGEVKIMQRGKQEANVKASFTELDASFCSLGQTNIYYEKFREIFSERALPILRALRDAAVNPDIRVQFENEPAFRISLLRYSEAEKAMNEARSLFGQDEYQKRFQFVYSTKLQFTDSDHVASFNFHTNSQLPSRIIGIVGRNGTGKTQYIANLAVTLSGEDVSKGKLLPSDRRPSFGRVFAVSYSAFDRFVRPPDDLEKFSYRYLGILRGALEIGPYIENPNGKTDIDRTLLTPDEMLQKLKEAAKVIAEDNKIEYWKSRISLMVDPIVVQYIYDHIFAGNQNSALVDDEGRTLFSSGQNILLLIITELIAYLKHDSLVLFDEPEMHLHPHAISSLIRLIHQLLDDFQSFAILSTHSPIIIQEIPAKNVIIFDRIENVPIIRSPNVETFGENLSILSNQLFDSGDGGSNYRTILDKLAKSMSQEQIIELFDNRLSLNGRLYLNQLMAKKQ